MLVVDDGYIDRALSPSRSQRFSPSSMFRHWRLSSTTQSTTQGNGLSSPDLELPVTQRRTVDSDSSEKGVQVACNAHSRYSHRSLDVRFSILREFSHRRFCSSSTTSRSLLRLRHQLLTGPTRSVPLPTLFLSRHLPFPSLQAAI